MTCIASAVEAVGVEADKLGTDAQSSYSIRCVLAASKGDSSVGMRARRAEIVARSRSS